MLLSVFDHICNSDTSLDIGQYPLLLPPCSMSGISISLVISVSSGIPFPVQFILSVKQQNKAVGTNILIYVLWIIFKTKLLVALDSRL